jgi:hypothetical protein
MPKRERQGKDEEGIEWRRKGLKKENEEREEKERKEDEEWREIKEGERGEGE